MGPGFCLRARRCKKALCHARPRDSLKQGLVARLPNKPLFYYKHYDEKPLETLERPPRAHIHNTYYSFLTIALQKLFLVIVSQLVLSIPNRLCI